jgi:hypothetical protein
MNEPEVLSALSSMQYRSCALEFAIAPVAGSFASLDSSERNQIQMRDDLRFQHHCTVCVQSGSIGQHAAAMLGGSALFAPGIAADRPGKSSDSLEAAGL